VSGLELFHGLILVQ